MLTPLLNRKRKAAGDLAKVKDGVSGALEQTRRIYGVRLLVRGLLWASIYLIAHGLLMQKMPLPLRVAAALLPIPFFFWYLWTWMRGVAAMDELERRIELEALGFAFPAAVLALMTIGLLDLAIALDSEPFRIHHLWLIMPTAYYVGLWRAKRHYA